MGIYLGKCDEMGKQIKYHVLLELEPDNLKIGL